MTQKHIILKPMKESLENAGLENDGLEFDELATRV